ncbi:hypothetical protein X777_02275 [Ooceraea biroi]|uniref:Uncharacterized protein n=1 Tax=Ooceraea biroi TaxID=2015173 RepID=A0A026WLZ7_OOCBI|nr:hypothetical protein X777_02275 [Ooceraea biroi]
MTNLTLLLTGKAAKKSCVILSKMRKSSCGKLRLTSLRLKSAATCNKSNNASSICFAENVAKCAEMRSASKHFCENFTREVARVIAVPRAEET